MLVNRDETNAHSIRVAFGDDAKKHSSGFSGPVAVVSFGSDQYVWINDGKNSRPEPDNPPVATTVVADSETIFTLPKASITVLRGKAPGI
jgi:hypothetical protein